MLNQAGRQLTNEADEIESLTRFPADHPRWLRHLKARLEAEIVITNQGTTEFKDRPVGLLSGRRCKWDWFGAALISKGSRAKEDSKKVCTRMSLIGTVALQSKRTSWDWREAYVRRS